MHVPSNKSKDTHNANSSSRCKENANEQNFRPPNKNFIDDFRMANNKDIPK